MHAKRGELAARPAQQFDHVPGILAGARTVQPLAVHTVQQQALRPAPDAAQIGVPGALGDQVFDPIGQRLVEHVDIERDQIIAADSGVLVAGRSRVLRQPVSGDLGGRPALDPNALVEQGKRAVAVG